MRAIWKLSPSEGMGNLLISEASAKNVYDIVNLVRKLSSDKIPLCPFYK